MTLKELFSKVKFDKIAEELTKHDPQFASCPWLFKQAFDRLRQLTVRKDDGAIIEVKGWRVWSPSRTHWDIELARQVKHAKSASLKKVAAAILWELTFYGFDVDDKPSFVADDFKSRYEYGREYQESELDENPYRRKWVELWQKAHDLKCRNPKDIGTKTFTVSAKSIEELIAPLAPEIQEKLKPIEEEQESIERMMDRYDLATDLITQHRSGIKNPDTFRQMIMDAPPFRVDILKAVCDLKDSADYLGDLICYWYPSEKHDFSLVLIRCPENVDSKDVAETLRDAFGSFLKLTSPKYILAVTPEAKEVAVTILTFNKEK